MVKRVFIVHGWGGYPEEGWFPWLKEELINRGFEVYVPSMPETDNPTIENWVENLKKIVKNPDFNTSFVGHSIGCQTILRYLQELKSDIKVGKIILVAPWFRLKMYETKEEVEIAKPWIERKIDFTKVLLHTKDITSIFSNNDYFVYVEDSEILKKNLGSKIIIEKNKGHFSGSDGIKKLPSVLNELTKITQ